MTRQDDRDLERLITTLVFMSVGGTLMVVLVLLFGIWMVIAG